MMQFEEVVIPITAKYTCTVCASIFQIILYAVCLEVKFIAGWKYASAQSGGVAQLTERQAGTLLTRVTLFSAAGDFSPRVIFQCRLSRGVHTALVFNCMH